MRRKLTEKEFREYSEELAARIIARPILKSDLAELATPHKLAMKAATRDIEAEIKTNESRIAELSHIIRDGEVDQMKLAEAS